jgi:hypothetical protein
MRLISGANKLMRWNLWVQITHLQSENTETPKNMISKLNYYSKGTLEIASKTDVQGKG